MGHCGRTRAGRRVRARTEYSWTRDECIQIAHSVRGSGASEVGMREGERSALLAGGPPEQPGQCQILRAPLRSRAREREEENLRSRASKYTLRLPSPEPPLRDDHNRDASRVNHVTVPGIAAEVSPYHPFKPMRFVHDMDY